jgi:hypothetical protein
MADTLERLAYSLALRALTQQERVLEELRARTGALLTATTVVTSFLGARALDQGGNRALSVVGIVLALVSIVLSVYVLAPKSHLDFALAGPVVYEHFVQADASVAEAERTLAYWIQDRWGSNQDLIDGLVAAFRWSCTALVLAIGFWSLDLALH